MGDVGQSEVAQMTTVYVTNRALTLGVREMQTGSDTTKRMIRVTWNDLPVGFLSRPDWHLKRADALVQAERMRLATVKDLRVQLDRLETMKFT